METMTEILPIVISLFAVAISFVAAVYSKKAATAAITTTNRMEWIKAVRAYCTDFLVEFNKDDPSAETLKALSITIQLYGYGDTYAKLFDCLNNCVSLMEDSAARKNTKQKDVLSQSLLDETQIVLNGVWWRVKREAGISKRADKQIRRQYKNIYLSNPQEKRKTKPDIQ